ncbi:hypothetical protein L3Y34_013718 [Caenorhabditis briggsae]|uniref:Uncharacterized protein n=1 Tax=Caenorhabditis briggsae TaxID=6238 RepID=A0AAE8ZSA8_CAEBR|nr:hypothetical protein L3Y34_013718 [Caenorhabditis briggsae]
MDVFDGEIQMNLEYTTILGSSRGHPESQNLFCFQKRQTFKIFHKIVVNAGSRRGLNVSADYRFSASGPSGVFVSCTKKFETLNDRPRNVLFYNGEHAIRDFIYLVNETSPVTNIVMGLKGVLAIRCLWLAMYQVNHQNMC